MTDLFPITLDEMIQEIAREISLRKEAYPRWVAAKRMSQARADKQVAVLEAVSLMLKDIRDARTA